MFCVLIRPFVAMYQGSPTSAAVIPLNAGAPRPE